MILSIAKVMKINNMNNKQKKKCKKIQKRYDRDFAFRVWARNRIETLDKITREQVKIALENTGFIERE